MLNQRGLPAAGGPHQHRHRLEEHPLEERVGVEVAGNEPERRAGTDGGRRRARLGAGKEQGVEAREQGGAVGDALGAPLEFLAVLYPGDPQPDGDTTPPAGFEHAQLWADKSEQRECNRFNIERGQWTDDTAMALCLADSLIAHSGRFHPRDFRLRCALVKI